MKLDYIILCHQRSGSHLLCTLLNSHPDIACLGESSEKMPELTLSEGKVVGKIIMYNRAGRIKRFTGVKIIHLIRDPLTTARSHWVNCTRKFLPHTKQDVTYQIELDSKEIEKRARGIDRVQKQFRNKIQGLPHIEISYEAMTGGKSVSEINESLERYILSFLGVPYHKLYTELKKPKWIFK